MGDQAAKLRSMLIEKTLTKKNEVKHKQQDIKIYAVSSGKGGVGKTNIVLNTAIALQRMGKRVLIIDTDFGFSNVDVLCGLTPNKSFQDVLSGDASLQEVIIEGPEGIKIIPGGSDVSDLKTVSQDHQKVLQVQFQALNDVDIILIDTGAGLTKTLMQYVMFAKELLLVITPEPTAITDAYNFLKVIDQYKLKKSVHLVVNRAESEAEGRKTFLLMEETIQRFLSISVTYAGCVKDERNVSLAVKKQTPFVIKYANSQASKDIKKLAFYLLGNIDRIEVKSIQDVFNRLVRVFS